MDRLARTEIARLRYAAGFKSAKDAAQALSCSRVYLLEIEEGRAMPSEPLLERLAGAYNHPVHTVRRAAKAARRQYLWREIKRLKTA